jgi:hypothetical protein
VKTEAVRSNQSTANSSELKPYNTLMATPLHETILVISKTFEMVHEIYDKIFSDIGKQETTENKISLIRLLHDAFVLEKKLLKGLGNIRKVYEFRYQEASEQTGMKQLNRLYGDRKKIINASGEQYAILIQSLSQQTSGAQLTESLLQCSSKEWTTEEAARSLIAYCDKYCDGLASSIAMERIKEGQTLLKKIHNNAMFTPDKDPQAAQTQLANITWFLMYTWGLQKKRGACEFAFVIEGTVGWNLYDFMKTIPKVYPRASSHFIGRSPKTKGALSYFTNSSAHLGIDIQEGLLPARKRTILFEMVDSPPFVISELPKKVLFFKPENWGMQDSILNHSREYLESVQKKSRAEGEDDAPGMQKERVPDNAKKAFIALLDHIRTNTAYGPIFKKLNPDVYGLNIAFDKAKLWGIAYMHAFINVIETQSNCPAEFNAEIKGLKEIILSLPHHDRRTGRELYITKEELKEEVFGKLELV